MMNRQTFANKFRQRSGEGKANRTGLGTQFAVAISDGVLLRRYSFQVFAFKGDMAGIRQHLHDGFTQRGFAGTGLADDAQCFRLL